MSYAISSETHRPQILPLLFPKAEFLYPSFPFLIRRRWLLPFAWGARILKFFWKTCRSDKKEVTEGIRYGKKRVRLLKKYKIRWETQLRKWSMKYHGHEKLKSSGTGIHTYKRKHYYISGIRHQVPQPQYLQGLWHFFSLLIVKDEIISDKSMSVLPVPEVFHNKTLLCFYKWQRLCHCPRQ